MRKLRVLALLLLISLVAFPASAAPENEAIITLERTACFGICPVYTITIYEDGTVVYEGGDFVEITGRQTAQINAETVAEILDVFEEAGYFQWDDEYLNQIVTDHAYVITSVTRDGETKQITRYDGDNTAPIMLPFLENWIDRAVRSQRWTGIEPLLPTFTSAGAPVITLERTVCFGACPVYSLTLYEDGTVIYMGFRYVAEVGVRTTSVDAEDVAALAEDMVQQGYFDWEDEYTEYIITDAPYVITSLTWEGEQKHIVRYGGDTSAPDELADIENAIDHLADVSQWLPPQ